MRIEILPSAKRHGITEDEIRTVLNNYELRISIPTKQADLEADDYFYVGRPADNEPHIELIVDHIDVAAAVVFHAMNLRPATVRAMELERFITPEYSRQRC